MVAMPQFQELKELPSVPPLSFGETFDKLLCDALEEYLELLKKTLVTNFDQFVTWIANLDLEADDLPILSEQQVAHYLSLVELIYVFKSDFDHDLKRWDKSVDFRGNWRGLGTLDASQARQIKRVNFLFRKMSKSVRNFTKCPKSDLIAHLLVQVAKQRALTTNEKIKLLHTIPDHRPIDNPISLRRADWYGDDD